MKAQSADLVLWNGFNLERWFERFFENVKDVPSVVVTDGIEPMGINEGPYTGKPNPHAWMSPANALIYVENIRKALAQHDPANADDLQSRMPRPMRRRSARSTSRCASGSPRCPRSRRWLVTSEGAFSYLARDYKMREAFSGRSTPTSRARRKQVRTVIDLVRENKIPVVFSESTISDRAAKQVATRDRRRATAACSMSTRSAPRTGRCRPISICSR